MIHAIGLELKPYNFTTEGLLQLKQSVTELKEQQRTLVQEMQEAQSQSTSLHALEDSLYTVDQAQVAEINRQIALLEQLIQLARVIAKPSSADKVQTGSTVTVRIENMDRTYMVVCPIEADPLRGRLSEESPFGKQLLGKRVNDTVAAPCPADKNRVAHIIAIA